MLILLPLTLHPGYPQPYLPAVAPATQHGKSFDNIHMSASTCKATGAVKLELAAPWLIHWRPKSPVGLLPCWRGPCEAPLQAWARAWIAGIAGSKLPTDRQNAEGFSQHDDLLTGWHLLTTREATQRVQ